MSTWTSRISSLVVINSFLFEFESKYKDILEKSGFKIDELNEYLKYTNYEFNSTNEFIKGIELFKNIKKKKILIRNITLIFVLVFIIIPLVFLYQYKNIGDKSNSRVQIEKIK